MAELETGMQRLSSFRIGIASGKVVAGHQSHVRGESWWIREDRASGKHLGDVDDRSSCLP